MHAYRAEWEWEAPDERDPMGLRVMHFHRGLELIVCDTGQVLWGVGDQAITLHAGEMLVLNAGILHMCRAISKKMTMRVLKYDPVHLFAGSISEWDHSLSCYLSDPANPRALTAAEAGPLLAAFDLLYDEVNRKSRGWSDSARGLVRYVHTKLCDRLGVSAEDNQVPASDLHLIDRLAPALEYIVEHVDEKIRVSDLTAKCNMSDSTMRRAFQSAFGKSPQSYLAEFRVQVAQGLLRDSSKAVIDVAEAVGFGSLSCFNRTFKMITGVTPREWRKG